MRIRRLGFVVVVVAATAACGLSVVGSLDRGANGEDGGGTETGANVPEGATGDSQVPVDLDGATSDGGDAADAFVDYTALCNQECPDAGGSCDGGTCVHDCSAGNACSNSTVRCPPGVPCAVTCGSGACSKGVDCSSAASCNIDCDGMNSCATNPVTCSGSSCTVTCQNGGSCTAGVLCDAGTCKIDCIGMNSCSGAVSCNGADCSLTCVQGGSCTGPITCRESGECSVTCVGTNTCTGPFHVAGKTADVSCIGGGSCSNGLTISAADASTNCTGPSTCGQAIYLDGGGHGSFQCLDPCNYCCAPGTTCTGTLSASANCP